MPYCNVIKTKGLEQKAEKQGLCGGREESFQRVTDSTAINSPLENAGDINICY